MPSLCMQIGVAYTSFMDILRKELFRLSNKLVVVHQLTPYAPWVRLEDLDTLPTDEHVWTGHHLCVCVGGGGGVARGGGLRVCGEALTLPFR